MVRKVWLGIVLALLLSVVTAGFTSQARTCRRLTIWIGEYPYLSHPICADTPVDGYVVQLQDEIPFSTVLPVK